MADWQKENKIRRTGGTLYIGIDDNGNVLGLGEKIVKKLLEDIPNKITAAFGMTCDVNLMAFIKNNTKKDGAKIMINEWSYLTIRNGH